MNWIRVSFLVLALLSSSGFRFRCFFLCTDQTSTQDDYVEQRDRCRDYAQLKMDAQTRSGSEERSRKSQLVTLFSECMSRNGWTVPDGREGMPAGASNTAMVTPTTPFGQTAPRAAVPGATAAAAPVAAVAASNAEIAATHAAFLHRSSECAFARQNAAVSSNAAARAKACDLECRDRMRAAPDLPRPAACPAEPNRTHDDEND